jgi:AcrR family transcriptional regulator
MSPQAARTRRKKRDQYHHGDLRRALLDEALRTVRRDGIEALTLRAIGQSLGVSRTALYRHFADKRALLTVVATEGFRLLRERLIEAWESAGGGTRGFNQMGMTYIRFAIANPSHYRVMFGRPVDQEGPRDEALNREAAGAFQALVASLIALQKDGSAPYVITDQGTLNPAADAALRAYPYENIFPRIREAVRAEDYAAFDYSGVTTQNGQRGWGSTSVEPRKHHVYTGLTNSIGILLETPSNSHRVMRDGTVQAIPQDERYYHQIRGGVIATSTILRVAAERRAEIRALTTGSRQRAIEAGQAGGDPLVLDYELGNRGNEPVWMPDDNAPMGYTSQNVPVFLRWTTTRTTPRPVGYLLPPSMAKVVPILQDHDIAVYQFREPATFDAEVYYATSVSTDSYFQGHYLKSVEAEKREEQVEVVPGWFWVPTAQSRGNLISYIMEPETDDNLITWGWADHMLQERAPAAEGGGGRGGGGGGGGRGGGGGGQEVPMIRVMSHQRLPVVEVQPFNIYQRNRYFRE